MTDADWPPHDWTGALARAEANAPFLSLAMRRFPDLVDLLAAGEGEAALAWAGQAGEDAPDLGAALRREKRALALALAIGDLAGAFALPRVTAELTALADRALDAAIAHAIAQRVPGAPSQGFVALALGKQGAGELNYSSDIDPILLFDPLRLPRRARDDPGEAGQHVARTLVRLLSAVDAEGYVFRVDLRLRPASEVSPLAIPVEAALAHYESLALAWERAAFIRARSAAGDVAMGEHFLDQIRPFVWRKSLDFGAIVEIGRLTRRIRAAHGKVEVVGPGFDLKRGRGGIREIEFFAQTHQLIHGGRNPALRVRGTRASLDAIAVAGLIDPADAVLLGEAYDRLRTIEHRLQMVSDLQTHSLPKDPAALEGVARLEGLESGAALVAELTAITGMVGERYDRLIAASPGAESARPAALAAGEGLEQELARLGFAAPEALAARIDGWRGGTMRCLRTDAAIAAFDAIQPALLAALAHAPEPDRAFTRWEQMLARLPSGVNLFRLLEARPALLEVLVRILSLAPPLADELARRADLLDALIDASAFDLPGSVAELEAELAEGEHGDDYQRLLDRVRRRVGEKRFALGVQLIEGAQDPLAISAGLARVAEAALAVLARGAIAEFESVHGRVPGAELVVLGLGRMGGGMLTHSSDLDLIFLFTGDHAAESDGRRPLGATLYFNRLAPRVSAALSVPTAEGALYEVDTRLRPQGAKGPLAASLDSFARYQREGAWTWEHMALARARVVFGSAEARRAVAAVIGPVLAGPRDAAKLRADVLEMRARMAAHKHPKGALDVKLLRGGLVDVEFLIHYLQLREGVGLDPNLGVALDALVAAGLLPGALAEAFAFLSRLLVGARLLAPDGAVPPTAARAALAKACACGDWEAVMAQLAAARRDVGAGWAAVFGEKLEIEA
jgi:glutamate-ammonia-ligase adenylyltransferase